MNTGLLVAVLIGLVCTAYAQTTVANTNPNPNPNPNPTPNPAGVSNLVSGLDNVLNVLVTNAVSCVNSIIGLNSNDVLGALLNDLNLGGVLGNLLRSNTGIVGSVLSGVTGAVSGLLSSVTGLLGGL